MKKIVLPLGLLVLCVLIYIFSSSLFMSSKPKLDDWRKNKDPGKVYLEFTDLPEGLAGADQEITL